MKKQIIAVAVCLLMITTLLVSTASAASYWYVIDEPNGKGEKVTLTAEPKEYTQVSVNTEMGFCVTVSLHKITFLSSKWYGDDQMLCYGNDRRAWWYGDTTDNAEYFIQTSTPSSEMMLSGYFQNF